MITIVTVCYNSLDGLKKTFESIRKQTNQNFKYVVVDGASKDGTTALIEANNDIIDAYISEKDSGIYDAMNKSIKLVNTEYFFYLNADDILENNFVEVIENIITESYPDYIFSSVVAVNNLSRKRFIPRFSSDEFDYSFMPFPHPGLVIKKDVFNKIGLFNQAYRYAADLDWILRLISSNSFKGVLNDKANVIYTIGGVGNSFKSLVESVEIYMRYNNAFIFKVKLYTVGILKLIYLKIKNIFV